MSFIKFVFSQWNTTQHKGLIETVLQIHIIESQNTLNEKAHCRRIEYNTIYMKKKLKLKSCKELHEYIATLKEKAGK